MPFQENINLKKKSATVVTLVVVFFCSTYWEFFRDLIVFKEIYRVCFSGDDIINHY